MKEIGPDKRKTGRPLSFDREVALEKAMLAFWASGYETTSVADLTAAMAVNAPSLYAAFGNKQQLFLEAMQRYAGDRHMMEVALAGPPTAREAILGMLQGVVLHFTGETTPPGCLLASAAATGSHDAEPVRAALAADRRAVRDIVARRITADVLAGRLAPDTPAQVLADLVVAVIQGLSVLARDGADRKSLHAIAEASLQSWATYEV